MNINKLLFKMAVQIDNKYILETLVPEMTRVFKEDILDNSENTISNFIVENKINIQNVETYEDLIGKINDKLRILVDSTKDIERDQQNERFENLSDQKMGDSDVRASKAVQAFDYSALRSSSPPPHHLPPRPPSPLTPSMPQTHQPSDAPPPVFAPYPTDQSESPVRPHVSHKEPRVNLQVRYIE